jgi:hypothetical protein
MTNMTPEEFKTASEGFAETFKTAYLENVQKAIRAGALDLESDLNYATLKAISVVTAEAFHRKDYDKLLKNLRCFI